MPRICPLRFSSQHDPCCHIMSYHPAVEGFFFSFFFLKSSCGISHRWERKDKRERERLCANTCTGCTICVGGGGKCVSVYVLEDDRGNVGKCSRKCWQTHSNILETHAHIISLSMMSSVPCVSLAATPGSLHTKVTTGWPGMISHTHTHSELELKVNKGSKGWA